MNRRGILKLLGAAPVAAPMAAQAAAAGLSPAIGAGVGQMALQDYGFAQKGQSIPGPGPSFWKERLQELTAMRGERRANFMRRVSKLDPDLAESRSLSLGAKIRLQAERDEQRDFDEESNRFMRYAKEAIGL